MHNRWLEPRMGDLLISWTLYKEIVYYNKFNFYNIMLYHGLKGSYKRQVFHSLECA